MKKILEIYDISDEYQNYQGNPYIVVLNSLFEADKDTISKILNYPSTILNSNEWNEYKNTVTDFNNNDAKHRMRKEQPIEYSSSDKFKKIKSDEIDFDNNSNVTKAINMLSPQPKSRFIKYYLEEKTYKEIALEEGKHISTIQESIKGAKKKFLKYLNIFENTPEK
ncbi:MAG: sigma-70 region 4 domain-containing protein [Acetobacter sp.]|nr:sigma-70 region 4 domain-containing protein [Bacteroides sp.]MCM1340803.1 sigma-70 region 4 domain-containing protein [Acetobacter sp.]MCM1432640.1 sigma-70 region 4 domain-containing protein [Clostridiales bacterium]